MKYWNERRVKRVRDRREARERYAHERYREQESRKRTYTKGDARKNARLMLSVLGSPFHRRMLARLRRGGAMSVTHLSKPFRISLPNAMRHVHILERAGLITTTKRGRIRYCIYNPAAPKKLATWFGGTKNPYDID